MPTTRGNLSPAEIENLSTGERVYCMFNPHEYTLTKRNRWEQGETKGTNVPNVKFSQGGAQQLKLQLFFDTYAEGTDVRRHTDPLWKMMKVTEDKKNPRNDKSEPPYVAFRWGQFEFQAVLTDISQKFTLFDKEGTPLRTTVDVSFQEAEDQEAYQKQNPTSGGGAAIRTHVVRSGERLDWIAAQVYGNASLWRLIAQANHITHPLQLRQGQQLIVPPLD